ncbi:hypothetical protein O6H91_10G057300 [Diphasiastrum complanatum]|uniref:Uncharacterized protein n=1 Tax=Diphasiastrum complanatum TaxID=34168 RepID=A0ACC2CHN1_DIPCM|nr:hypothetical protein O6H91_10G057300 [Diphasiastrum complanatum]
MDHNHRRNTTEDTGSVPLVAMPSTHLHAKPQYSAHFSGSVKRAAYKFDGKGSFLPKEWDLQEGVDGNFCWYHVELPRSNHRLALAAQYLIDVLCPPLKLQDILSLVSNGPFCGYIDGALIFRVNSAGPTSSRSTHRISARITQNMMITVSLGRVPRLEFATVVGQSLLSEVPILDPNFRVDDVDRPNKTGFVIQEHVLEFLLTMNHPEEADKHVPMFMSNLIVHVVDTHIDYLQDIVLKLEMDLDDVERELDKGGYVAKKHMLDSRRFPKMHLDLQRLLQVIAQGEQVFPRVKEKCAGKTWCAVEDLAALEGLIARLRKLKENVGLTANRITAIQAGLDSWQSEQINRKLYYLSFLSMIFLPLSIVTGAFGMNVGGVPWTDREDPHKNHGFRNVILLCTAVLVLLLACFGAVPLYSFVTSQRRQGDIKKRWLSSIKSIRRRSNPSAEWQHGGYNPL